MHLTILKKSYFPIINTSMAILEMKTVLRYVLFSFSKRSVFTFLIMKPKTKLSFSFSNIGSIITNFVCQNIKNIFWVRVKGTTLNFKYFPHVFVIKVSVLIIWSRTWQVPFPTWFRASSIVHLWRRYSHYVVLKAFTISESHYLNLRKNFFILFIWC